jgi:photosystem II stability/assembly factor-like uncharacterized protein
MKKLILILLIVNCQLAIIHSQWLQMPAFPVSGSAYSIAFINKDTGYVSMDTPALLSTTNGGQSWSVIGNYRIYNLQFVDSLNGFGSGKRPLGGIIYKTTNAGFNWDSVSIDPSNTYLNLFFVSKDTGWVCGGDGNFSKIWKTTNGGVTLQQQISLLSGSGFGKIFFLKQKINNEYWGWALIGDIALYRTTNSGVNWTFIYQMESVSICGFSGIFGDFYFKDTANGIATRSGGCYMITTNGGYNWNFTKYNGSGQPNKIGMATSQMGWITLSNDTVIKTTNFFQTYGKQKHFAISGAGNIFIIDTSLGYTASYVFGKTTNGGGPFVSVNQISSIIPNEFILYQNYPNPFNPVTNIKFTIPSNVKGETSNVKLIVFDILGREIVTIINEKMRPGTYEVKWNAENIPSGIYFYTLETNKFKETKKMSLLK